MMWQLALVAIGGALGACSRYGMGIVLRHWALDGWPLATLLANVMGSLGIGIATVLLDRGVIHADIRALVVVGFFGAFTTFSTFSMEMFHMLETGEILRALVYALVSLASCLLGVFIGVVATRLVL